MRVRLSKHVLFSCLATAAIVYGSEDDPLEVKPDASASKVEDEAAERLTLTQPVACRSIEGFESFEPLPEATLTADEKLLVYYHPLNYRVVQTGKTHHIHLAQAGQIRRRGEKAVLLRKENLLDFEVKVDYPPNPVYLKNTISLKGLKPGDYDYDVILRDKQAPTQMAKQTLQFRVIAADVPKDEDTAAPAGKSSSVRSKSPSRLRRASHARVKRHSRS